MNDRLKLIRKELGLTQRDFAKKLGFPEVYILEVEKNITKVNLHFLVSLDKLGVNLNWLFYETGQIFVSDDKERSLINIANLSENISSSLKMLRKKMSLNQTDFAEKLGVSPNYYSAIECCATDFLPRLFFNLIGLNLNLYWLFTGEGEMFRTVDFDPSDQFIADIILICKQLPESRKKSVLNYAADQKSLFDLLR